MYEDILSDVGLSKNEALVYLSALRLGDATAGEIADDSKLHRPNVYDSLDRLSEHGFISQYLLNNVKVFRAANPKVFLNVLDEKKQKLNAIMPNLLLEKDLSERSDHVAEVYKGVAAFRRVLENQLNYNSPIYAIGIPKQVPDILRNFINLYHKQREERGIWMHHIYNEDADERIQYLKDIPFTTATAHPDICTPTTTHICGDEMLLITWNPFVFVRVVNKELAKAWASYAEIIIKKSKLPS